MDQKHLLKIARQVTKDLAPSSVEAVVNNTYSGSIRVVSEHFLKMSLSERFETLYELFYAPNVIPKTFLLEFEAWTAEEHRQLSKTRKENGNNSGSDGSGRDEDPRKAAQSLLEIP
jgi:hypothetical protein